MHMVYIALNFIYTFKTTLDNNYSVNTFCHCRLSAQNAVSYSNNSFCDFTCRCDIIMS